MKSSRQPNGEIVGRIGVRTLAKRLSFSREFRSNRFAAKYLVARQAIRCLNESPLNYLPVSAPKNAVPPARTDRAHSAGSRPSRDDGWVVAFESRIASTAIA